MKKLLILGASVRAAAQSAVRAGFTVVAGDLFADQDTREIAHCVRISDYPHGLVKVRQDHLDLPAIYTGALENYPEVIRDIAKLGPLFGNGSDVVRRVRAPLELQATLRRYGVHFPATRMLPPDRESSVWLQKAIRSAGGQQVRHHDSSLGVHVEGNYYQEFVDGDTCSAAYVASHGDAKLLGITESLVGCSWAGATNFEHCGSVYRSADSNETEQWKFLGKLVADEFSLTGVFGIDAVIQNQQVIPIEVNPRYTASMEVIELATRLSVLAEHFGAFEGQACSREAGQTPKCKVGKAILYADQNIVVPSRFETPTDSCISLADIPNPGEAIREGRPILTIILRTEADSEVTSCLKAAANNIRSQLQPAP